jgi:molybdate transport system substrate-binding protein
MFAINVILLSIFAAVSCNRASSPAPTVLHVMAAASLTQPFTELGKQFQAAHPGTSVVFDFGGSNQLRIQLQQGADADLFASANHQEMQTLSDGGIVNPVSVQIFAHNRLSIIVPKGNPAKIQSIFDLAKPGVKLIVADPAVPAGSYLLGMLKSAAGLPDAGVDFSDRVLANVKSKEENVKAVVSKIELGEGDAGVAYMSDLHGAGSDALEGIEIPPSVNPLAEYPVGIVVRSKLPELSHDFEAYLLSANGQQILANYGFLSADTK